MTEVVIVGETLETKMAATMMTTISGFLAERALHPTATMEEAPEATVEAAPEATVEAVLEIMVALVAREVLVGEAAEVLKVNGD